MTLNKEKFTLSNKNYSFRALGKNVSLFHPGITSSLKEISLYYIYNSFFLKVLFECFMIAETVSHYKIVSKIGSGGMGMVYKAEDLKLQRFVVLKFLLKSFSDDKDFKKQFIEEARAASKLQHNNICTIHEINETEDGQLFICMDYYEGETLKEKIKNGPIELDKAIDITKQICNGLNKAHLSKIIHRDIKPANIFITTDGVVKILDFGLAKTEGQTHLTLDNSTAGTVAYMSPEQIKGEKVDSRTDIWALGVVFYEMISGERPFKGEYDQAIIYSILNRTPSPLDKNKFVNNFWVKCLEKKPEKRYQSIDEVLADLIELHNNGKSKSKLKIRQNKLISIILFSLLILASVFYFINNPFSIGKEQKQVAVLPFINIGSDSTNQAFCDGLTETLTSQLTQIPHFNRTIQVIPSTEIRRMQITSAKDASQIFGADLAVTGSIQIFYDRLRLVLNLVDANSLRQISSSVDDYSLANVYNFQDEVVSKLSQMMEIRLNPEEIQEINSGETDDTDAYIFYTQGRGYLQNYWDNENINNAINLFYKALDRDSQYVFAAAGLSEAYILKYKNEKNTGWIDSALAYSKYAKELNNNLPIVRITSGMVLNEIGKFEEAISEFKKAIEQDSYNSAAYDGLALAYESLNMNDKAEQTYKQAIKLKPAYWVAYNKLGAFYTAHGNFNEALKQFKKVVELTPENTYGLNNLGAVYFYTEKWNDAKLTFEQIIKLKPDYYAYSNLGSIYFFYDENYKNAAEMFEKALELDSSNYVLWGNLAASFFQIQGFKNKSYNSYKRAIEIAEKELEINPGNPVTLSFLASYNSMLGNEEKSIQYLEKSLNLSNDIDVTARNIETYETLGQRDKALQLTEKILEKGYPISKLEKSPDLKDMLKDERFEYLKKKFSN